jgi:hypothetical protein
MYNELGAKRNAYRILVGKSDGKRQLRRPRRRWVNNIKMILERDSMGWCGVVWIDLAQVKDRWKVSCEHGNEPSGSIKC